MLVQNKSCKYGNNPTFRKHHLNPTTYFAGGTEAQKGQVVCQRLPSPLLAQCPPLFSAMHISKSSFYIYFVTVTEMANKAFC